MGVGTRNRLIVTVMTLSVFGAIAGPASAANMTTDCAGLQNALDQAVAGDTITLTQMCTGGNSAGHFDLSPSASATGYTLLGQAGSGAGFDGTGVGQSILTASNSPAGFTIRNLTFQNGSVTGLTRPGAAISLAGNFALALDRDTFTNNQAASREGGAVSINTGPSAAITISNSTFQGNSSGSAGGAVDIVEFGPPQTPVTISGNTFSSNTVAGGSSATDLLGGAVTIQNGSDGKGALTQTGNTFSGNSITGGTLDANGGAEATTGMELTSTGDVFTGNTLRAPTSGHFSEGAALSVENNSCNTLTLQHVATNLVVAGNSIVGGGAAGSEHGALYTGCGEGSSTNPNNLALNNSTISGNSGGGGTAGIWGDAGDQLTLQNSIVAGDSAGAELTGFGSVTATFTDLCNGASPFTGSGNICVDPHLVNAAAGDVHEVFGSPTVDAGSNALVPNGVTTDVYGAARIQPKIGGNTPIVDIGAAELPAAPLNPSVSITTPADVTYALNQVVASSFTCTEGAAGPGISSCLDQNGHGSGTPIDTSTTGEHSFTVTATSADGLTAFQNAAYRVAAPPTATISAPASGHVYALHQVVPTTYACRDGASGPGLVTCATSNSGDGNAGGNTHGHLLTSTVGRHTYTVTATSGDGQTGSASISYTVAAPPSIRITTPVNGRAYRLRQRVRSSFRCTDGAFGTGLARCADTRGRASGAPIDTSRPGLHSFTVIAVSRDGQRRTKTVAYRVRKPPKRHKKHPHHAALAPAFRLALDLLLLPGD